MQPDFPHDIVEERHHGDSSVGIVLLEFGEHDGREERLALLPGQLLDLLVLLEPDHLLIFIRVILAVAALRGLVLHSAGVGVQQTPQLLQLLVIQKGFAPALQELCSRLLA